MDPAGRVATGSLQDIHQVIVGVDLVQPVGDDHAVRGDSGRCEGRMASIASERGEIPARTVSLTVSRAGAIVVRGENSELIFCSPTAATRCIDPPVPHKAARRYLCSWRKT